MNLNSFTLWILVLCTLTVNLIHSTPEPQKNKRTIGPLLNKLFGFRPASKCGSRPCPPWKCQDDSAVIHGHCCHCPGSEYDNVPVPCYPDLKCPMSSEPLCSDYNFMIECCCTGP